MKDNNTISMEESGIELGKWGFILHYFIIILFTKDIYYIFGFDS